MSAPLQLIDLAKLWKYIEAISVIALQPKITVRDNRVIIYWNVSSIPQEEIKKELAKLMETICSVRCPANFKQITTTEEYIEAEFSV